MGAIIDKHQLAMQKDFYRLVIYVNNTYEWSSNVVSINKLLAEELRKLKSTRRTMSLEKCFINFLDNFQDNVVIRDIDVVFNPSYKIDVIRMFVEANKHHPFSLIWPGRCNNHRLIYSEEGLADYKTYEISDYDIVCVV